jgi:hypothetical protein
MENFGIMKGILMANGISFVEKLPQVWMKKLPIKKKQGATKDQWKKELVQLCKQHLPGEKITKENADAALMALYYDKII